MEQNKKYDRLIKILQTASAVLMAAMLIAALVLMKKYNISLQNISVLEQWLSGSVLTVALIIIAFSVVKSFALVISPSLVYAISGLVFDNVFVAIGVNFVANVLSVLIPYFLGRFTGAGMYDSLKRKYPKVKKIDDFIGENEFLVTFIFKSTNMIPGDITNLVFGAIGISFKKFIIAAAFGALPLNILWSIAGNKGDFSDPKTALYVLPVTAFSIVLSIFMKWYSDKQKKKKDKTE